MKRKKTLQILLSVLLMTLLLLPLTACGGKNKSNEFEFTGEAQFDNGTTYHARILGNKDTEQTFTLTVDEMPNVSLGGTWTKVEGKGYKLYFDDAEDYFAYTKYSEDTNDFTFSYSLSLGGGYGSGKFQFACHDKAFAAEYDGVGLGNRPPIMTGGGWGGSTATNWRETKLVCYEDGTCTSTCLYKGVTRDGTWSYDQASNVYSFTFEPEEYTYFKTVGVWENPGNSQGVDFGTAETFRHAYWEGDFKNADELAAATGSVGRTEVWTKEEGARDYTTATWQNDGADEIEFKTTYDEATKTYTLVYEQIDSFFYVDRMVSYTLED